MNRAALPAIAALLAACAPLEDRELSSADLVVLGPVYELRAPTYLMDDPTLSSPDPEAQHRLGQIYQANNQALFDEISSAMGGLIVVGTPAPTPFARSDDKWTYDFLSSTVLAPLFAPEDRPRANRDGSFSFEVMRRMRTNEGLLTYPGATTGFGTPAVVPGAPPPYGFERTPVRVTPQPEIEDAWPDYEGLFRPAAAGEDGVLDVDVHFGVLDDRGKHMDAARAFLDWLLATGFDRRTPPGPRAAGEPMSGPYVRTMQTPYGPVDVEVRVIFGRSWTPSDPTTDAGADLLAERARESLATRDVVVFIGHNYGPDATWTTGMSPGRGHVGLTASEFGVLPLTGRAQLIVAEGCGTAGLANELRRNPSAPAGRTPDLLSSSSSVFVDSDHVARKIVELLASMDAGGRHVPHRYLEALFAMQLEHPIEGADQAVRSVDLVEGDPRLHPYFDPAMRGRSCTRSSECGAGAACLPSSEGRVCTPECATDAACGPDRQCLWDPARSRPGAPRHHPREPRYCLDSPVRTP